MNISGKISTVSIIGSGNVATSIGIAFAEAGINIVEIVSATDENAKHLASRLDSNWVSHITELKNNSDLYIIAVPDNEIESCVLKLKDVEGIVVHTSGSKSISVFENRISHYGIFYPPQTMTMEKPMEFMDIPICIEASDEITSKTLTNLAKLISNKVVYLTSEQRQYLHLTAVTVNNFTNLLYHYAHDVLKEKDIDFELLLPLIRETAMKVHEVEPHEAQTGPARRNDLETINKHISLLKKYPDYKEIYSLLSKKLIEKYHDKL